MPLLVPSRFTNAAKSAYLLDRGFSLKKISTVIDKAVFSHFYNNGFGGSIEISPEGHKFEFEAYAR